MHSILSLIAAVLAATASFALGQINGGPASRADLVSETSAVSPGSRFTVALSLKHPQGWHSYYRNSGGVELPPSIQWKLPDGITAGEIQWPVPEVKDGHFGKSFIYPGNPVFLVDLTASAALVPGSRITLGADASWQICDESCINEEKSFTLELPVEETQQANPEHTAFFSKARAALPATRSGIHTKAEITHESILLSITGMDAPLPEVSDFIPDQPFAASISSGSTIEPIDGGMLVRLKRITQDALDNEIPLGPSISGILIGTSDIAIPATPLKTPAPDSPPPASSLPSATPGLAGILFGMFLGGLILNLMPCVFPVIGLKIMGFVQQAGSDNRKIMLHGLVFTAGVLLSFAVLSSILFAFKSTWGFQLQNPWVVLSLMILMFLLALNMFGVFEMGTSATSIGGSLQSKQGMMGSFFSGVLATVVATPCSAPFLGTAMAAAVNLPAAPFFTAFTAMAVGLSTPYLVLSMAPRLVALLPRPGAWMESFKQGMSFLLFGTTGYLLWVYASQIDLENLLGPIFGLCAIGIAAWIHGRWNVPAHNQRTRMTALGLTIIIAASGLYLTRPPATDPPAQSTLEWQTWSQASVDSLLAEGKPVYIDFTATWCATCQVNKKRAYTPEVIAMMREKGVVALRADKSKPNPEIDRALQRLDRTAIPVNVLLAPGKPPVILPELLSPSHVLEALRDL